MLGEAFYLVDGLCGIGVANKFRVQVAGMVRRFQGESEIVHGEDVFQEFRSLEITDAASLAARVEFMGQRVCAHVEIMVVF
jgi:hypothetical protein